MNIKEQIKTEHEKIKLLSDSVINQNLSHLHNENRTLDFCSEAHDTHSFLNKVENVILDDEDRGYYNYLLGRKLISYDFQPSNRKRAEALLAVISTI